MTFHRAYEAFLVSVAALAGAMSVAMACAASRDSWNGGYLERTAMYSLGGSGWTFDIIAWNLAHLPALTAAVTVFALLSMGSGARRGAALRALAIVLGANVSGQLVKGFVGQFLPAQQASVPSGHVLLAVSAACALVMLTPVRWRAYALVVAGVIAAFATTGVIAAYWHVPGDVVSALAVAAAWLLIVMMWSRPARGPQVSHSFLRDVGIVSLGGAWAIVTMLGWGTCLNAASGGRLVAGVSELTVLPLIACVVVAAAARAV